MFVNLSTSSLAWRSCPLVAWVIPSASQYCLLVRQLYAPFTLAVHQKYLGVVGGKLDFSFCSYIVVEIPKSKDKGPAWGFFQGATSLSDYYTFTLKSQSPLKEKLNPIFSISSVFCISINVCILYFCIFYTQFAPSCVQVSMFCNVILPFVLCYIILLHSVLLSLYDK